MFSHHKENQVYNVTLINESMGLKKTIKVRSDEYILDAAEQQGIALPVSCRAGICINCTGRLVSGEVEQDHSFLRPKELAAGFLLTCKSYPLANCVMLTHQEDDLLDL
ncbi:2Fe-2S iron-sulfur cluster-binding protein [Gloeocapsa sp. PCC 73106]|uniref:2Fe-2S iron-sulfur cluster-binding protein n=1 Tax=Gloeocapsa sp. PCC 73106 TaxID=102232 RepID=UPI0002AC064C|nr:2Fe-2S iron-sulfur cluster-binding protein [Gloeocapsa sp. PCC 73106]ELR98140.1 ferredoxin, (2Fe-2S) [Gloeocapsa sp. PCC 73106]